MTRDEALRRSDELLTELIESVETARAVPMSASCVLPREKVLDLLDELREVLPPEMDEARTVIATRDRLLKEAYEAAAESRARAVTEADALLAESQHNAEQELTDARDEAAAIMRKAHDEHERLVASTTVHEAAAAAAAALRADAEQYQAQVTAEARDYDTQVRAEADRHASDARAEAERYATKLTADAEDYADRTLDEMASTLHKAATTAEQGRAALRQRRAGAWTSENPRDGDEWSSISA
jgi:cell division septum initiation protein DivIVA